MPNNLSFDFFRATLLETLESSTVFADYDLRGRNISVLIDLFAKTAHYLGVHNVFLRYEMSPYTARTKAALYLHAMMKGVCPVINKCSSISATIKTPMNFKIDKDIHYFTDSISGQSVYITDSTLVKINSDKTRVYQVTLVAGNKVTDQLPVKSTSSLSIYSKSIDVTTLSLSINNVQLDTNINIDTTKFIDGELDCVIVRNSDNYEILYRNRSTNSPDVIVATYIESVGEDSNGISTDHLVPSDSNMVIQTSSTMIGGLLDYSLEQIRSQVIFNRQQRGALLEEADYKALVAQFYPDVIVLSANDTTDNGVKMYGTVNVAAVQKSNTNKPLLLSTGGKLVIQRLIERYTMLGLNVQLVDPIFWNIHLVVLDLSDNSVASLAPYSIPSSSYYEYISTADLSAVENNASILSELDQAFKFTGVYLTDYTLTSNYLNCPSIQNYGVISVQLDGTELTKSSDGILYFGSTNVGSIDLVNQRLIFKTEYVGKVVSVSIEGDSIQQSFSKKSNIYYYIN